jgi:hypothetical protein
VKILQEGIGRKLQCINSWWVFATQLDHCFGCKYCISTLYPNNGSVGCVPLDLLTLTERRGK